MSKAKTETKMDSFQSWAHRWGRVGTLIALIYMVALPFVVLAAYDSIPSLGEVFNVNTFSILLIYIPVGFMVQGSGRFAFIRGAGVTTPHLPKIDK